MNLFKPFLAGLLLITASAALSGCGQKSLQKSLHSSAPQTRIETAEALKKTVSLAFTHQEDEKGIVTLSVFLENPEQHPLTSFQVWLGYNPKVLEGISLKANEEEFPLAAPYKNGPDNSAGLVKIGRSAPQAVSSERILVGDIVFKRLAPTLAMIDGYNYQPSVGEGHLSANTVHEGVPYNLLIAPETPTYIIPEI